MSNTGRRETDKKQKYFRIFPVFLAGLEADPGETHNLADELTELCRDKSYYSGN